MNTFWGVLDTIGCGSINWLLFHCPGLHGQCEEGHEEGEEPDSSAEEQDAADPEGRQPAPGEHGNPSRLC